MSHGPAPWALAGDADVQELPEIFPSDEAYDEARAARAAGWMRAQFETCHECGEACDAAWVPCLDGARGPGATATERNSAASP
jgi:hypothetical protein